MTISSSLAICMCNYHNCAQLWSMPVKLMHNCSYIFMQAFVEHTGNQASYSCYKNTGPALDGWQTVVHCDTRLLPSTPALAAFQLCYMKALWGKGSSMTVKYQCKSYPVLSKIVVEWKKSPLGWDLLCQVSSQGEFVQLTNKKL